MANSIIWITYSLFHLYLNSFSVQRIPLKRSRQLFLDRKTDRSYFEEIVPEYDKERVYVSDMKKIIQWYNLLTEKGMLDLDEEAKEEEKKEA